MQIKTMVFAFALSMAATGTLFASEIYKWTDEEGNVHYSDLPTGAAGEEHLAIRSRPTDPARVQAEAQARVDDRTLIAEKEANAPQGPTPEELRAEARERQETCNKYRDRQTKFTENRRIYKMDENGERVYYDEEEMRAARAGVDDLVEKYCK
jgi:hypothetical protein